MGNLVILTLKYIKSVIFRFTQYIISQVVMYFFV